MTAVAKLLPCPFCGSQPKSGWQGASVPGMEDCGYWGIDCCNAFAHAGSEQDAAAQWNRRAALSPAELGGVELTTSFIQEVPDRCDRIIWRGHYYHLPVNSASTPRAAEAISLVDIGLCNWAAHILSDPERFNTRANDASAAIRRLVAALTPPSAKGECK